MDPAPWFVGVWLSTSFRLRCESWPSEAGSFSGGMAVAAAAAATPATPATDFLFFLSHDRVAVFFFSTHAESNSLFFP